jgi:competence protein ComEA
MVGKIASLVRAVPAIAGAALLTAIVSGQTAPGKDSNPGKDSTFPDGPGKTALLKVCSDCHGPESAVGHLKTRQEWSRTLDEMAANGAQGTDQEWEEILGYLDKYFSLILVNKDDEKQLANRMDVAEATTAAIVSYRDEHGRFATIEDLKRVPGLDPAKVDALKDRLVF